MTERVARCRRCDTIIVRESRSGKAIWLCDGCQPKHPDMNDAVPDAGARESAELRRQAKRGVVWAEPIGATDRPASLFDWFCARIRAKI